MGTWSRCWMALGLLAALVGLAVTAVGPWQSQAAGSSGNSPVGDWSTSYAVCTSGWCNGQRFANPTIITAYSPTTGDFSGTDAGSFHVVGRLRGTSFTMTITNGAYISRVTGSISFSAETAAWTGTWTDSNHAGGTWSGSRKAIVLTLSGTVIGQTCSPSGCARSGVGGQIILATGTTQQGAALTRRATSSAPGGIWSVQVPPGSYTVGPSVNGATIDGLGFDPEDVRLDALSTDVQHIDFLTCLGSSDSTVAASTASVAMRLAPLLHTAAPAGPQAATTLPAGRSAAREPAGCDMGVTWTMPRRVSLARSNIDPLDGMLKAGTGFDDATPKLWKVNLALSKGGTAVKTCPAGAIYHWTLTASGSAKPLEKDGLCKLTIAVPKLATYRVTAVRELPNGKKGPAITGTIVVRDWLIIGLGDSNASGEGAGIGSYYFQQCDRSVESYQYQVAAYIEAQDPQSSVTFLFAACSGARMEHLVDQSFSGHMLRQALGSSRLPAPLKPQLEQVTDRLKLDPNRSIGAVLLSIGVNDLHFGPVLDFCTNTAYTGGHIGNIPCNKVAPVVTRDADTHDVALSTTQSLLKLRPTRPLSSWMSEWMAALRGAQGRFAMLAAAMDTQLGTWEYKPKRVFITEYPSFSTDQTGAVCTSEEGARPRFVNDDWRWLHELEGQLNGAIAATNSYWTPVGGIAAKFYKHGYCSSTSWFRAVSASATNQLDFSGGFHAIGPGQDVSAKAVEAAVCRALYRRSDCSAA